MKKGRLFIISAPSGTGKSTVVNHLLKKMPDLVYSISYTTRPPRGGEQNGKEYCFVDESTFKRLVNEGFFAEWAEVHGALYGTPRLELENAIAAGKNVVLDIDVQGGMALKKRYPQAVTIFLAPPSFEELKERLSGRKTDSQATVAKRLENATREMGFKDRYEHCIVNDDLKRACGEIAAIVRPSKKPSKMPL